MMNSLKAAVGALALVWGSHAAEAQNFDWPQWRGPDRSDVSRETGLLKSWPKDGPRSVWRFEKAGIGYGGPAIARGRVYILGTRDDSEVLFALDEKTGSEIWVVKVGGILENTWGDGPRSTPTVDGDRVYVVGATGTVLGAKVSDGSILWQKKMSEFGGRIPDWGYTESPLIDGGLVVVTPGAAAGTIVALDKMTGVLKWQTKDFNDGAQYASIVPADLNGARQYIQLTQKSVVGVGAVDGRVLWRADFPGRVAVIPTPIVRGPHVYVTAGYGVGCKMIRVGPDNQVATVYENKEMKNHHGGVILVGDHVYGHSDPNGWVCQDFLTGQVAWTEKAALGKGAIAYADGRFYCLDEGSGTVVLIEASPKGWAEHGRFKLAPQSGNRKPQGRIWTHPVISNGRLYLRDQEFVYCYDIKA